ncbi:MAG: hypothetical protein RLZZ150_819, partial [Bacteroidota bacterium]
MTLVASVGVAASNAQDQSYEGKYKNSLKSLSNYRYGDISVFRVEGQLFTDVSNLLNPPLPPDTTGAVKRLEESNFTLFDEIRKAVRRASTSDKVSEILVEKQGFNQDEVADRDVQTVIERFLQDKEYQSSLFKSAYIVTTKYQRGDDGANLVVVALVKTRVTPAGNTVKDLSSVNGNDIIPRYSLTKLSPPANSSVPGKLYDYLKSQVIQNNVTNVTLEAQGIDDPDTRFVRQVFGNSVQVSEDDVQQYIKITNGIPVSYVGPNEITLSAADLIAYRRYAPDPTPKIVTSVELDSNGEETTVEREVVTYNGRLPLYGIELRYGLEDINYPSIWSERVSVNAVWSQARLGVILPTSGWSSLSTSLGSPRTMTNAGFGVNANVEVPIKLIAQSGVFNIAASYVFDDAVKSDHQRYDDIAKRNFDHLVRFHAQLQYTFAVRIDDYNLVRMRLGGTAYQMERWADRDSLVDGKIKQVFSKYDNEFIGGVSGKIEFMNTNWSTPLGASLQYFDESILINTWLQFQASPNLGFRIDANVFTPVFRDARAWENDAVFMPSLR